MNATRSHKSLLNIFTITLCLLGSLFCSAQQTLLRDYYFFDSCPDPRVNHIATRKVYEVYCSDTTKRWLKSDTVTEFYDRKGNLTAVEKQMPMRSCSEDPLHWHHYRYDRKGRIISDSTFRGDSIVVMTYEYKGSQVIIRNPPSEYSDILPTVVLTYDDNKTLLSEYRINSRGDTMYSYTTNGNRSSYTWMKYSDDDSLQLSSITSMGVDSNRTAWRHTVFYNSDFISSGDVRHYDTDGRLRVRLDFSDSLLRDCTVYFYNNNLLYLEWTRFYTKWDTSNRYNLFTYNVQGQLLENREWSDDPDTYIIHRYVYNERGLRIEENVLYEYPDGRPDYYVRCERWEWTYYE